MDIYDEALTLENYFKGRAIIGFGNFDTLDLIKMNAMLLLENVKALLRDLDWHGSLIINSGYRNPWRNANTPHAAKHSLHMEGRAIDLHDEASELWNLIYEHHLLLQNHGLWMEDKSATPTWVHLDMGTRTDRAIRVFKP